MNARNFPAADSAPRRTGPRLVLVLLTLAVVAAHALLLQAWTPSLQLQGSATPSASTPLVFNTRRLEAAQSQPAAVTAPARAVPSAPRPSASTPPASPTWEAPAALPAPAPPAASAVQVAPAPEAPAAPSDVPRETANAAPGSSGAALVVPASVRLNYSIDGLARGIPYSAQAVLTWLQEGGRYDAKLTVSVFLLGQRSLSSVGEVTSDGLQPRRFSDKSRSELAAHFLPEQGRISFSANTPDRPWQRGAQDRLSVFFQLASLLAGEPERAIPGTQLPVYVVGPRDAEEWVFKVGQPQTLDLPMGATPTVYLLRLPRREYEQRTELWLAPQLGFLPVRIKQTHHNGDYVDQQLSGSSPP